jgi:hypothetical protein
MRWCYALAGFLPLVATAAEHPTIGLIFNTKDRASLEFNCEMDSTSALSCDFVQVSLRPKATPTDLAKSLEDARKQKLEPVTKKTCDDMAGYVASLEGRAPMPPKSHPFETDYQKQDMLKGLRAALAYCQQPSRAGMEEMARITHDKEARTCLASSYRFHQIFRRVSDAASNKTTWVVKSEPSGPCGIVQLDRFEAVRPFGDKMPFWEYTARKAVTNPSATDLLMKCSDFDESTYVYTWDTQYQERAVRCDYIEFSAF